jgi:hypothetical protein
VDAAICGAASISFTNVTSESADLSYSSNVDVYGFQFNIQGVTLTGASSGFDMTSFGATGTVIGFSMSGSSLSSGEELGFRNTSTSRSMTSVKTS